jgi:hypothetical protein
VIAPVGLTLAWLAWRCSTTRRAAQDPYVPEALKAENL